MDPSSITAESISIIHLCARTTISLARWTGSKQTTNGQINTFCGELRTLSATYDALNNKLRSPIVARATQSLTEMSGGKLWQHAGLLIKDCENTLMILNQILDKYSADSKDLYQRTYQVIGYSMANGDIFRLRQRIPIFDMALAFLLQLIVINDQLGQQMMNMKQYTQLDAKIKYLEERLTRIQTRLEAYSQSAETNVAANWSYEDDSAVSRNFNSYVSSARIFLASAATKSGAAKPQANTMVPVTHPARPDLAIDPNLGAPLNLQDDNLDPWTEHPHHAVSSIQAIAEPSSHISMLSPTAQPDDFFVADKVTQDALQMSKNASWDKAASNSNYPFQDSSLSFTPSSVDTASLAGPYPENKPQGTAKPARRLSNQAQEFIASRIAAIRRKCTVHDPEMAAVEAIEFMKTYIPTSSTIPHLSEVQMNVMQAGGLGLAGTGYGYAPLHFFTSLPTEYAFEVSLLIKDGVDVNATILAPTPISSHFRPPYHTALQLAAERGHANITELLASEPDIDLEVADSRGLTPLLIAWRKGHLDVVKVLLRHGANSAGSPDVWQGNSLLHGAAWLCHTDLVRLLIALGADVNARNAAGSTPLIAAVISTDIENARLRSNKLASCVPVMKLLLDAGAKFRLRNNAGRAAMYYAELERNAEAVALLEGRGAGRVLGSPEHPHDVVGNLLKRVWTSPTRPQMASSDGRRWRSRTMST